MTEKQSSAAMSRRRFLRDAGLLLTASSGLAILSACKTATETVSQTQTVSTTVTAPGPATTLTITSPGATVTMPVTTTVTAPPTATAGAVTLMAAINSRKSASAWETRAVPETRLLELLYAAWGINRPESGKRTAPSAINAQEIDIYVATADGVSLYDARANQLQPVLTQDARSQAALQSNLRQAPVHLIYVADYAKLRVSQAQGELWSACHTGFIGQNVYLFCAAEGLGCRFHTSIDRAALKETLKLRADQAVVFAQVVGYAR